MENIADRLNIIRGDLFEFHQQEEVRERAENRVRTSQYFEVDVKEMSDEDFRKEFNITREVYEYLCARLENCINKRTISTTVPERKKILLSILILTSNAELKIIASLFGLGVSTVWLSFHTFIEQFLKHMRDDHIGIPSTAEFALIEKQFNDKFNFPGIIGVIDGTHFPFECPAQFHCDFYNYKSR